MNTTVDGSSCASPLNSTAAKIGITIAFCLLFVLSLLGNSFIGIIVYTTQSMRKPINYFITNMALSDLLFPIFIFSEYLTGLYAGSWLISGSLGQALCKLLPFFGGVSSVVSIQSMVLIAVDRYRAVVFPLRSPVISSKLCPFFILATWIVAMAFCSPSLLALKVVEYPDRLMCEHRWNEAFGESSSVVNSFLVIYLVVFYIPIALLTILYTIILIKLKTQVFPGEQSTNAEELRAS